MTMMTSLIHKRMTSFFGRIELSYVFHMGVLSSSDSALASDSTAEMLVDLEMR